MKKNPNSKLIFSFILLILLNISSGANILQESSDWTQPFRRCWSFPSEKILSIANASDNNKIFLSSLSGEIKAINSLDREDLWNTNLGGEITSDIISDQKNIYVLNQTISADNLETSEIPSEKPGTEYTSLHSLDSSSGITNWKKTLNRSEKTSLHISNSLLLIISENGYLAGINTSDGATLWETDFKQKIQTISQSTDTITLGTSGNKILTISTADGKTINETGTKDIPNITLLTISKKLVWGDKKGFLTSLDASTSNPLWKRRFGGEITNITETPGGLFISSADNFIYLVNENTGKIIWKRRLAARVNEKPFIRGNTAIIFAFGESTAIFIELNKGKIINSITLSDANYFTGSPLEGNKFLIFPTLHGLYAFGNVCAEKERTDR